MANTEDGRMHIQASTIVRSDVYAKGPGGILAEDMEGEFVILDVSNGDYYRLNKEGSRIWQLLHQGKSMAAVRAAMLEEYAVSEECLTADLVCLLSELQAAHLIEFHAEHGA